MKLALVTGGCRRLGAAIAATLAGAGWSLALHGRSDATPDPALAEVLAARQTRWSGFAADLADPDAVAALVPAVTAHFGMAPTLLVNNASLFGQDDWRSMDAAAMATHYAVNAIAPALFARALVAAQSNAATPVAIVNLLDQRIRHPHGEQFSYTASKLALAGITEALARAMAPMARVNAVAPGLTLPTGDYDAEQLARLADAMPLKRLPTPADVAAAVLFLAESPAITGQTLFVDGGAQLVSFDRDFVNL